MTLPSGTSAPSAQGEEKGPDTSGIVQTEMDALTSLDSALQGVEALSTATGLMEDAASKIVAAGNDGKTAIDTHVAAKKIEIDQHAATAVTRAMAAFSRVVQLMDPFLALFRKGE